MSSGRGEICCRDTPLKKTMTVYSTWPVWQMEANCTNELKAVPAQLMVVRTASITSPHCLHLTDRYTCLLGCIDEYVTRNISAGASLEGQPAHFYCPLLGYLVIGGPFTRQDIQSSLHRFNSLQIAKLVGFKSERLKDILVHFPLTRTNTVGSKTQITLPSALRLKWAVHIPQAIIGRFRFCDFTQRSDDFDDDKECSPNDRSYMTYGVVLFIG
jgi:hypothetical protein